ncbi:Cytochrome c oxidase assembly protein COX19 [Babesia sp. Xinjiang]|uniref:Cytochrome c oxidase assembly protein COX19 n=1 Tax=Babesia sp. Xinjiang TaxID=462227 RepID=UPI000A2473BD|nr:Cytochrome c oxidase assembly protein COX19 [Babesia sp. Xinjiang]ORM41984.1 Cytochrome c oxidase assembly protein COX19 [Babesia sp. Xinjiang]
MTVGQAPRLTVIPPDRGSFPLDHEGLCKEVSNRYLKCVQQLKGNAFDCRALAAEYMKCRIDNKLLAEEPLVNLGFRESEINADARLPKTAVPGDVLVRQREDRKESQGFVAGQSVVENYAREQSILSKTIKIEITNCVSQFRATLIDTFICLFAMAENTDSNIPGEDWAPWTVYNSSNVYVCRSLSHLLYRLHTAPSQKHKFVLSTHIRNFEDSFRSSEVNTARIIMALDPDYLALMLRSSVSIASCALSIITSLVCDDASARHLVTLLPHICSFMSFLIESDDKVDPTTEELLQRCSFSASHLKARLISDCLSILTSMALLLGRDTINASTMDSIDLTEAVDDLSRDMFDVAIADDGAYNENAGKCITLSLSYITIITATENCHLCELIERREFKEAAMLAEQLERELDALAAAHLDESMAQAAEAAETREEADLCMGPLLLRLGQSILQSLSSAKGDHAASDIATIYLTSLKCTMELIPSPQRSTLLGECLSSDNLDVMVMLFELCTTSESTLSGAEEQIRISSAAAKLLDQSLHKSGIALASSFLAQMLERYGLAALGYDAENKDGGSDLMKRLCALVRRTEIEIHLGLYDFLRCGSSVGGVSASFLLLETILVGLGEQESLLPSCHDLFATIHRTMNTVFEFFDELAPENKDKAADMLTCCSRLIGCWMTLEPLHLKSLYLRKLPKMLSVISPDDFKWLLPTFDYIDAVDLDAVPSILSACLNCLSLAAAEVMDVGHTATNVCNDNKTFSMCYGMLERLFLEGTTDCAAMLASVDLGTFRSSAPHELRGFDYGKIIERGNVHFSPRPPLEVCIPIPVDIHAVPGATAGAQCVVELMQSDLVAMLCCCHPRLRRSTESHKDTPIDLKAIHEAIDGSLTSSADLRSEWSDTLCKASLATAAVCLCRLHQSDVRTFMEGSAAFIVMVHLKPVDAHPEALQCLVDDGWISADSASSAEFVCSLASAIR